MNSSELELIKLVGDAQEDTAEIYNKVINFAINLHSSEAQLFLRIWNEGDWEELEAEFPEFYKED